MSTCTPASPPHLTNPGHLLSCLPGLLGFYPSHSFILLGLYPIGGTTHQLGPVLRVDVEALNVIRPEDFPPIVRDPGMSLLAFIVGFPPDSEQAETAAQKANRLLDGVAATSGATVLGVWAAEEITHQSPYRLVPPASDDAPVRAPAGTPWERGTIPEIVAAPSMEPWRAHGLLPEIRREDHFGHFTTAHPALSVAEITQLTRQASDDAADAYGSAEACRALLCDLEDYLNGDQPPEGGELGLDYAALRCAATVCAHRGLRDAAASVAIAQPDTATELFAAVASAVTGSLRVNALCLYALARATVGPLALATAALATAAEEAPEHTLTRLLQQAFSVGLDDVVLDAIRAGSEEARRRLYSPIIPDELP
ncbi:DUF4192 domain-containing protein [Corynebacterium uterequi]|uniref:Putative DUF4192 family protein n=1 Tax=Corynebacterium uterequi TaxID=1072256 RepID=A0A0G3HD31_9CORY|nr:DUF4192 domain-containing protein [Corynebacterium uterequi]AKK11276.1 putative DUF4192 family protein [Corynebacterium uterequi]